MSFEVEGKLYKKFDTVQITDTFRKRQLVLTLEGNYPQQVSFELIQDRCGILDDYQEGMQIKVFFDLRGREWTSPKGEVKYFNTLHAWKIEAPKAAQQNTPPAPQAADDSSFPAEPPSFEDNDDLPF